MLFILKEGGQEWTSKIIKYGLYLYVYFVSLFLSLLSRKLYKKISKQWKKGVSLEAVILLPGL